ncbi:hypothetical protein C4569_01990 [Candidatus Parcubacteria bacterium]|nr:MAG: hypothetical protein C4569_01990 [Candidatus Parcubacteria bacterium]
MKKNRRVGFDFTSFMLAGIKAKEIKMKCFQRKLKKAARPGSILWVEVDPPKGVLDAITKGKEYPGPLFWGHWNTNYDLRTDQSTNADVTQQSGMWPDWVVIMDDGTRKRIRFISDTTGTCPSGPCGKRSEYVLFSADEAAKANLEAKAEGELLPLTPEGILSIYQDPEGISFLWEGREQLVGYNDLDQFFQEKGFAVFEEWYKSSYEYGTSFGNGQKVEVVGSSFSIKLSSGSSRVYIRNGGIRLDKWSIKNGNEIHRGEIIKVEGGKATKVSDYDPKAAKKKEFGRQQFKLLIQSGWSENSARAIMHAAGPGRAVEAAKIACDFAIKVDNLDVLDALCAALENIANGGETGYGKERKRKAAAALGLPEISGNANSIGRVLMGVVAAIQNGLPARETMVA